MAMLQTAQTGGHPVEYLLGRIGGRRGYLITDWEAILAAPDRLAMEPAAPWRDQSAGMPEEAWRGLLRELAWVYRQMEPDVRNRFAPVFGWFEIRTLLLCLRNSGAGNEAKVKALLARSLLSGPLKKVLRKEQEAGAACRGVAKCLAGWSPRFARLERASAGQGMSGFEQLLTDLYLEEMAAGSLHPVIALFFRALIDLRNLMTLYKQMRWRIGKHPAFLHGGSLGKATLRGVLEGGDQAGILHLAGRLTGKEPTPAASLETHLLCGITRRMQRQGVAAAGTGTIFEYLWSCYVETRNLSVILQGGDLDPAELREELIR
jgi:vacuolar-type H+-ATPase subunit C/Vma6